MTKEKLLKKYGNKVYSDPVASSEMYEDLKELFESNICIPKGENRHPYADVLHVWIEGDQIQYEFIDGFGDMMSSIKNHPAISYRLKPSEPVYEYKWSFSTYGHKLTTDNFMTDAEVRKSQINFIKIEQTKRERK